MNSYITDSWDSYLQLIPNDRKDIYFEEKYVKMYETDRVKAVCFIYEDLDNIFLLPFLRREFIINNAVFFDLEIPYGYGGSVTKVDDGIFLEKALFHFYSFCKNNSYIAGFFRFHPLLNNQRLFETIGGIVNDRNTIAIDTSISEEGIWMNEIATKNRNLIKKAKKNGLVFIVDSEYKFLDDFIRLYDKTMDKLSADSFFYFDHNYYQNIKEIEKSFLGHVVYNNKIISSAIFFYSDCYGHYHLSGSDLDYISLLPNNLLLYEATLELKRRGVTKVHLGGGTSSESEDSLFQFKKKFSKGLYHFYIGKVIFNDELYLKLVNNWIEKNRNNCEKIEKYKHYLLKYKY